MINKELRALRQFLALECSEAAEHIGNVSTRSWQRWEDGTRSIPDEVADMIIDFANLRNSLSERRRAEFKKLGKKLDLNYYLTIEDFERTTGKRNVVMWRITNSVAGECLALNIARLL